MARCVVRGGVVAVDDTGRTRAMPVVPHGGLAIGAGPRGPVPGGDMTIFARLRLMATALAAALVLASYAGCSIVMDTDGGTSGDGSTVDFGDTFGNSTDVQVSTGEEGVRDYWITGVTVDTPGMAQNTSFNMLVNQLFALAFSRNPGVLARIGDFLHLLIHFESVQPGISQLTFCQAHTVVNGQPVRDLGMGKTPFDGLQCHSPPYLQFSGPAEFKKDGTFTIGPTEWIIDLTTDFSHYQPITFRSIMIAGTIDTKNGTATASLQFLLGVKDACNARFNTGGLCPTVTFPDGVAATSLIDMLDGPLDSCGQDGSADLSTCMTGNLNPPDTSYIYQDLSMNPAYTVKGTIKLSKVNRIPGNAPPPETPQM
jgi:hypothetical protein